MGNGTARHGTARHGTARHGTARHGTARHGTVMVLLMLWLPIASGCDALRQRALVEGLSQHPSLASSTSPTHAMVEHDLGFILARGDPVRCEFLLRNPFEQPLRLLQVKSMSPCCSSVERYDAEVPAQGAAKIAVVLNAGFLSGRKPFQFAVKTDNVDQPNGLIWLWATFVPALEIELLDGSDTAVSIGEPGRQLLRVTCRDREGLGLRPPVWLQTSANVSAEFTGPPAYESSDTGLIESTRDIEVTLPADTASGAKRAVLALRWPEGTEHEHSLSWRVLESIQATPASLVLDSTESEWNPKILLASTDAPFEVIEVRTTNARVEWSASQVSDRVKMLRPFLCRSHFADGRVQELVIQTDHPRQSSVAVSLLLLPRVGED